MKKIIATLTAIVAAMTFGAFAEKYVSANDLDLGSLTSEKVLEDDFVIKATPEKGVDIQTQSSDAPNKVGDEVFTQRIKIGGKGNAEYRSVAFPAKAGEKVTVIGKSSSKTDSRSAVICSEDGTEVGSVTVGIYSEEITPGTVTIPADGNYYVTSKSGGIYIYEITIE